MLRKERFKKFITYFSENFPEPKTELNYSSPFELLVAVVLSAQCTDKRVNIVTSSLFKDFATPKHIATSSFDELFPYIKSISYPNNKTKHLLALSKILVEEFNGEVPEQADQLIKLPGVGRKTANVIMSVLYNRPTLAVDTHVFRVSKRLGLVNQNSKTPLEVEKQLVRYIPKGLIPKAHHWLILHGRYVCIARKPDCNKCKINEFCRFHEKSFKKNLRDN
ncbi:MAG TPA: endonuclease III [Cyclobacteriaceae bacterium]